MVTKRGRYYKFDELGQVDGADTSSHGLAHNSAVRADNVQTIYKSVESLSE